MKRLFSAFLLLPLATALLFIAAPGARAQFRNDLNQSQPPLNTAGTMQNGDGDSFWSRLFDPSRFSMHQSISSSFVTGGGSSMNVNMFTNTFSLHPYDNLFISADLSAVYSPFSSFGSASANSMNGVYLTNARLDWKLGDNTYMRVEYVGGPAAGMYGGYSPFLNPIYSASPFVAPTSATASVQVH